MSLMTAGTNTIVGTIFGTGNPVDSVVCPGIEFKFDANPARASAVVEIYRAN